MTTWIMVVFTRTTKPSIFHSESLLTNNLSSEMGPKKDAGDAKKKEILIDGKNVAALTDEQLLEFQSQFHEKLASVERENALLEVEMNMLRNAWKLAEDKANEVELENVMIRRELDHVRERMNPTQWEKEDGQFDKKVMYNAVKDKLLKLDQGPDDVITLNDEEVPTIDDPDSVYDSKPSDEEERFDADKRHKKANKRLKSKKKKFEAKVNELRQLQLEMEATLSEEQYQSQASVKAPSATVAAPSETVKPTASSTKNALPPAEAFPQFNEKALEEIALEDGTISTGSISGKSEHSVFGLPTIADDALADMPPNKRKPLDPEQRTIRNLALLRGRKWKRSDPRYDDTDECDSNVKIDSDDEHIFDDYNPMLEEDVEDPMHFYQMRKWLEYDYETLVKEMKDKMERRIRAMNYVWTKDVKNVMCAQLAAVENYDADLREEVRGKIEKEIERTEENEEHLKLLLQGLEEVRIKMIRERYATNMCIAKQQTEELNYLIQECYDRTINELKASTKFNFNLTQMFFMRSTENDISLVHELHSEQRRVEDHVTILKSNVENAKRELSRMIGPLEENERMAKWMETTIAALQKDMRSKKDQERTNLQLSSSINRIESDTATLRSKNMMIEQSLHYLNRNLEDIMEFRVNNKKDNGFNQRLRQMTVKNEEKIVRLKRKIRDEYQVVDTHLHMIRSQVMKNVAKSKTKKWHNLLETKAFNELVTQFDLRAREHQMKAYIGIDKLAIPYRKTSANILTTFDEKKKMVFPYIPSFARKTLR